MAEKERMAKDTEDRMIQLQSQAEDAVKSKQLTMDKKNRLKQVIETDHMAKLAHRARTNDLTKSSDF